MPAEPHHPTGFRFGLFEVSFDAREFRKHGMRLNLGGHPFEVLRVLLENHGQVITREQLRARLWPAGTYVDFEHGLNAAVKRLRAVLGDSLEKPHYIETLPRVGYRFIAPIEKLTSGVAAVPSSESEVDAAPSKRHKVRREKWRNPVLVGAFGFLVVFTFALSFVRESVPKVLGSTQVTTTARVDVWGRLSTDGVRLFFLERQGAHWNLVQKSVSGGEAQPLQQPFHNARVMDVSPDGAEFLIGEFERRGPVRLWLEAVVGGQPRRVGEMAVIDAVFTSDGRKITYSTEEGIFTADLSGANPRQIFRGNGLKDHLGWRPDGGMLRFTWEDINDEKSVIWEVSQEGETNQLVLPGWDQDSKQCCGRWTPDGRYYIFVSAKDGSADVWAKREKARWLHPAAREPVRLTTGPISFNDVLPSRGKGPLFVLCGNPHHELARFNPDDGRTIPLLGGGYAIYPHPSPDGAWLVYVSESQLWISRMDGREKLQLTSQAHSPLVPRWNGSGKEILYIDRQPDGRNGMLVVPAFGGAPRSLSTGELVPNEGDWSTDGTSIVFSARSFNNATEKTGLYLFELKTGRVRKIVGSDGLAKPRNSPDGLYLAAVSDDGRRVIVLDKRTNEWKAVRKGTTFGPVEWSRDSKYLYIQDILEEDEPVWKIRVEDGRIAKAADCRSLLASSVQRCGFEGLTPGGSPIVRLTSGDKNVYALDVRLP